MIDRQCVVNEWVRAKASEIGCRNPVMLVKAISPDDRKQLSKDVAYAPAWVGNIMRRLAGKSWNMDDFTKLDPEDRSIHILGGDGDAEEHAGGNS